MSWDHDYDEDRDEYTPEQDAPYLSHSESKDVSQIEELMLEIKKAYPIKPHGKWERGDNCDIYFGDVTSKHDPRDPAWSGRWFGSIEGEVVGEFDARDVLSTGALRELLLGGEKSDDDVEEIQKPRILDELRQLFPKKNLRAPFENVSLEFARADTAVGVALVFVYLKAKGDFGDQY